MQSNKKSVFDYGGIIYNSPHKIRYISGRSFIDGYVISYEGNNIPDDIELLYGKKLFQLGWEIDGNFSAGGPFGNVLAYKKGKLKIIFEHIVEHKKVKKMKIHGQE